MVIAYRRLGKIVYLRLKLQFRNGNILLGFDWSEKINDEKIKSITIIIYKL